MRFIEISMPAYTLFLKPEEIVHLLKTYDEKLFFEALQRGKEILKARTIQERIDRNKGI